MLQHIPTDMSQDIVCCSTSDAGLPDADYVPRRQDGGRGGGDVGLGFRAPQQCFPVHCSIRGDVTCRMQIMSLSIQEAQQAYDAVWRSAAQAVTLTVLKLAVLDAHLIAS